MLEQILKMFHDGYEVVISAMDDERMESEEEIRFWFEDYGFLYHFEVEIYEADKSVWLHVIDDK